MTRRTVWVCWVCPCSRFRLFAGVVPGPLAECESFTHLIAGKIRPKFSRRRDSTWVFGCWSASSPPHPPRSLPFSPRPVRPSAPHHGHARSEAEHLAERLSSGDSADDSGLSEKPEFPCAGSRAAHFQPIGWKWVKFKFTSFQHGAAAAAGRLVAQLLALAACVQQHFIHFVSHTVQYYGDCQDQVCAHSHGTCVISRSIWSVFKLVCRQESVSATVFTSIPIICLLGFFLFLEQEGKLLNYWKFVFGFHPGSGNFPTCWRCGWVADSCSPFCCN